MSLDGVSNSCVGADVNNVTEIWPEFTTIDNGRGEGQATVAWDIPIADTNPISIVVHNTPAQVRAGLSGAGPKALCVDLEESQYHWASDGYASTGSAGEMPELVYGYLKGTSRGSTYVLLKLTNLEAGKVYPSHVHTTPCDVVAGGPGGPHYVRDITCVGNEGGPGCPATADTELWPGPALAGDDWWDFFGLSPRWPTSRPMSGATSRELVHNPSSCTTA